MNVMPNAISNTECAVLLALAVVLLLSLGLVKVFLKSSLGYFDDEDDDEEETATQEKEQ